MTRIKILTADKVGITYKVLKQIAETEINIKSMEVIPSQIHLKLERMTNFKNLFSRLQNIDGIINIEEVKFLPYERREYRNNAMINAVNEGIIAINERKEITFINDKAEKILKVSSEEEMGKNVGEILDYDIPMLKTLKDGKSYDNKEIIIGESHYFTSGRPIKNEQGRVMGVVATLKDINEVRELYHTVHPSSLINFDEIIYNSEVMNRVVEMSKKVAESNSTVLIKGETGTGKELFARAIHSESYRQDKPFVPINCAALPDSLLESELFGYEEGAFTGAQKGGKQGVFELANKGTIFLDEIGEIPSNIQVKLLRVLEERKVRRVGGNEKINIDVRVISATNRDLEKLIRRKEFREDLYYRLNVIPINLPPLRERKKDLPYLIDYFLNKFSKEFGREKKSLSTSAKDKLLSYSWPGNVRELRNVLERAVNLSSGKKITIKNLLFESNPSFEKKENLNSKKDWELEGDNLKVKEIMPLDQLVNELEKTVLKKAQAEYKSSRQIGQVLGVSHTTVLNKLKKYGIKEES
ncbi:sigma 54-interacting transcriptional regulator [Sporohalobacter salinus]|uniref:sigma 54-interacting transcriptional regulator n=1 Tax=Sporohalobacter salinus TaxID=1494606 RepID=UPI001EF93A90|nr:sigma 54-interacting transcriptional regulator [Sporohalobacter salinus]MBM7624092.1 transcriptional regulator of aroF, aroG, tyrA and aromatic amino acid transport [Sporohalobacter salinus]